MGYLIKNSTVAKPFTHLECVGRRRISWHLLNCFLLVPAEDDRFEIRSIWSFIHDWIQSNLHLHRARSAWLPWFYCWLQVWTVVQLSNQAHSSSCTMSASNPCKVVWFQLLKGAIYNKAKKFAKQPASQVWHFKWDHPSKSITNQLMS